MTKLLVLRTHLDASQVLRNEGEIYEEKNAAHAAARVKLGIVTTEIPKPAPASAPKPGAEKPAATPFD